MAPINLNNPTKKTGTVPKISSSANDIRNSNSKNSAQTPLDGTTAQSCNQTTTKNRSTTNRKNTEIVAPTRRELNDLNDYLISVSAESPKFQNYNNFSGNHPQPDTSCFELENQRFSYPVRPIPRRTRNTLHKNQSTDFLLNNNSIATANSTAAAVGVVIPTTPANSTIQQSNDFTINNNVSQANPYSDLGLNDKLNFIKYILSFTAKPNNKNGDRAPSVSSNNTVLGDPTSLNNYDELQHRLESSNRNIQNIKDQQNQLLRLQQVAKQHLSDMEDVRARVPLRFGTDYENVEAFHSDMSNLVNRMKNLQTFIHNQNELSEILGDDSPDVLADQLVLQQKLNALKSHRNEMKNLVNELQDINISAERSALQQQNGQCDESEVDTSQNNRTGSNEYRRTVPIEYQRTVPIELIGNSKKPILNGHINMNGHQNCSTPTNHLEEQNAENVNEDRDDDETAKLIQKKMSDINAMKNQLQRLKDMMTTVQLIEEKTSGPNPQQIGKENIASQESTTTSSRRPIEIPESFQREFNKSLNDNLAEVSNENVCENNQSKNSSTQEEIMSERVRLLHEMTADLRDQAIGLASERDRLKAIKDEMKRRSSLNSNPVDKFINCTNLPHNQSNNPITAKNDIEKDLLKAEYEAKKKEFDEICQRLRNEDINEQHEINDDEDDDDKEQKDDDTARYYSENWQQFQHRSINNSNCNPTTEATVTDAISDEKVAINVNIHNRGKDGNEPGASDAHGIAAMEAVSMQSGSSRSYSMPPPMRSLLIPNTHENEQPQYTDTFGCLPPLPNPFTTYYNNFFPPQHMAIKNIRNAQVPTGDPALLHQLLQSQQTLINSICHCNQILWNQQREINNLNNNIILLQERISNSTLDNSAGRAESVPLQPANTVYSADLSPVNRAHSEQPLHNQRYQPVFIAPPQPQHLYQPVFSPNSPNRYHHQNPLGNMCHYMHQHRRHTPHNYNQHYNYPYNACMHGPEPQTVYPSNVLFTQRQPSPVPTTVTNSLSSDQHQQRSEHLKSFLNNSETLNIQTSAATTTGHTNVVPPPIFMHHHNNNIGRNHQTAQLNNNSNINNSNNSNSLNSQQNCLNSNQYSSEVSTSALNNQVLPGNRANNYWDNFRSYSRQNLLSSNSCKSNEEQNHLHHLQHLLQEQHQQQHRQPQQEQQNQHLQQHQQQHVNQPNLHQYASINNYRNHQQQRQSTHMNAISSSVPSVNNFNSKDFHTFRNEFNSINQPNQININPNVSNNIIEPQTSRHDTNLPTVSFTNTPNQHLDVNQGGSGSSNLSVNQSDNIFDFNNGMATGIESLNNQNNINTNNFTSFFNSPEFRNMNLNFGINEQKKIPIKTSYNSKRHTQSAPINVDNNDNLFISDSTTNFYRNEGNGNFNQNNIENAQHNNYRSDDLGEGAIGIDETSEEIKRNLLVNALKNDKFTSKIFETLKEDVYRQAYAIIQEKKSDIQFLNQFFDELKGAQQCDPMRNILTVNQNNQSNNQKQLSHEIESNDANEIENLNTDDNNRNVLINNSSDTVGNENSRKINTGLIGHDNRLDMSHEKNRDTEIADTLSNSKDVKHLAHKLMFGTSDQNQKNKLQDKNCDGNIGHESQLFDCETKGDFGAASTTMYCPPDLYILNYIMTKLRKQITHNSILDDSKLVQIAKFTVLLIDEAVQILNQKSIKINRLEITPKEIYTKIRNIDKNDLEQFLTNYENCLFKIICEDNNIMNILKSSCLHNDNNILPSLPTGIGEENANQNNFQQQNMQSSNQNNNYKSNLAVITQANNDLTAENNIECKHSQMHMNFNNCVSPFSSNNNNNSSLNDIASPMIAVIMNGDLAEADQMNASASNSSMRGCNVLMETNSKSSEENLNGMSTFRLIDNESERSISIMENDDAIGDNTSMNEEDQDEAEDIAQGFMNKLSSNNCNEFENENNHIAVEREQLNQNHYKKSLHSSVGLNDNIACALVFPLNNVGSVQSDGAYSTAMLENVVVATQIHNQQLSESDTDDSSMHLRKL